MPLNRDELISATEENPEALFELYGRHIPGATFTRDATMRRMCYGVPVPFFNGIAMARLNTQNVDGQIDDAIAEMNATGMPWSWQIGPSSSPFDLSTRLLNHGMKFSHDMPIMAIDLRSWKPKTSPPDYKTVVVDNVDKYEQWVDVAQRAFGLPNVVFDVMRKAQRAIGPDTTDPICNLLGMASDEPVCTGTVFYSHSVAGIFTIGTPEEFRGKGYGGAVTEACLIQARDKGFDTAFLQSSRMGYSVYERIGFQEICRISIFVPADS